MALTSINRSFERTGRGQLYLFAYPAANPGSDSTLPNVLKGFFGLFYTDADARKALKGGINPWANLDASGLAVKVKQNLAEYDPNAGPKHPIGIIDTEITAEFTFADVDAAHLADAFSCKTEEIITFAAATGKAGRTSVLLGGQSVLPRYVALYRMPSTAYPGEYEHYLFLRTSVSPDTDLKLTKKDAITMKLKLVCQDDAYCINSDGFGELAFADTVTAAGL